MTMSHADSSGVPQSPLTYERASGGSRSVDAITLALSRQHLQNDTQNSLAEVPASISASSLATPSPTVDHAFRAGSSCPLPTSPSESWPCVAIPGPSDLDPSAPPQEETQGLVKNRSAGANNSNRLWPKIPPRHSKVSSKNLAVQTLVENMICSETQCHVQAPPLSQGTQNLCGAESEAALEVDEIMSDDINLGRPVVKKMSAARCAMQPSGINKTGIPRYQSSTETALRCRNLVRNRPRMRKRTKLREKATSSAMSPVGSLNVVSADTVS